MSVSTTKPRGVHFVGSFPRGYKTTQAFQEATSSLSPGYLHTIPDGECEPVERWNFMSFQREKFPHEILKLGWGAPSKNVPDSEVNEFVEQMADIQTGYDGFAIQSYQTFLEMRKQGVIPKDTKFQVSLPSPTVCILLLDESYQLAVEPKYREAMKRALDRIQAEIPHHDLAIQWDVAGDMAIVEGLDLIGKPYWTPSDTQSEIIKGVLDRLVPWFDAVDEDVEVGCHLCYGDMGHQHWKEPVDTNLIVDVAISLLERTKRQVNWLHLPVPKNRKDVEYVAPLARLDAIRKEDPTTGWMLPYVFLGLVHSHDEEGTAQRIEVASSVVKKGFGIATECGLGRTPDNDIESILEISAKLAAPY